MTKALIIAGPTATGKTALAVAVAKRFDGEIVSADSRQVYKGLDSITGKDIPRGSTSIPQKTVQFRGSSYSLVTYDIGGIPVWLYDVVDAGSEFSISIYRHVAERAIEDIRSRGKLPIIVGGSGLYIESIVCPPETIDVPRDSASRMRWATLSVADLQRELQKIQPGRLAKLNASDRENPRRLVRALEVARWQAYHAVSPAGRNEYDPYWIGLEIQDYQLHTLIEKRVHHRWKHGALEEVRDMEHASVHAQVSSALGISPLREYIAGEISGKEALDRWTKHEEAYAKRQMTWFRAKQYIHWFRAGEDSLYSGVEKQVREWYT